MAETLPLRHDADGPRFALKVDGGEVEASVADDVLLIDVHEEIGRLARATVLLQNWNDDANAVKYSDGDSFRPGKKIEIHLGYESDLSPVFEGVIVGLGADFLPARQPVLRIDCRCKGVLLSGGRRSRVFEDSTDGDAVSAIAGDYGLSAEADAGPQNAFLVQDGVSDWDFLARRARTLGMVLYVRGDTLAFRAANTSAEPAASLDYGATLLELRVDEALIDRVDKVTAAAWDPEGLQAATSDAGAADATVKNNGRPDLGKALSDAGWPKRDERLAHAGAVGPDELDAVAKAGVERGALGHLYGRGRSHGLPQIRIDALLELRKLGARFGGKHYVTAVRHRLDSRSYTTEFQLGQPPPLRPHDTEAHCAAAERLALGTVDDIDDPNAWGRVRVLLPWLDGEISSVWARLALPAAGPDRGFFFIPEVGDEVVVGFFGGDARFPVVLGSLWNGRQAPPESLDAQKNAIRSIVSRAGHRLTFDDSDDAPKVVVKTKAEQTITVDDTSGSEKIELADKTGNKLTLDSKGITLEAASGADVSIKASNGKVLFDAMQLEGKASASAKLQSSATMDLQASAMLGLTGGLVKINS